MKHSLRLSHYWDQLACQLESGSDRGLESRWGWSSQLRCGVTSIAVLSGKKLVIARITKSSCICSASGKTKSQFESYLYISITPWACCRCNCFKSCGCSIRMPEPHRNNQLRRSQSASTVQRGNNNSTG